MKQVPSTHIKHRRTYGWMLFFVQVKIATQTTQREEKETISIKSQN